MASKRDDEGESKKRKEWDEFECPECTAHNPYDVGFSFGDEVFCNWCGQMFLVKKIDDGEKFKLQLC